MSDDSISSSDSGAAGDGQPAPATPFASLPAELASALARRGFAQLTSVQEAVARSDTAATDLRISSQTGSGKTVAVGIAIARSLLAAAPREASALGPTVLVLAPTRELATQVRKELDWLLAAVPDAATEVVTGGTSVGLDRKNLSRRPRVLVGTPGRVLDHLGSGALNPKDVSVVVLDEADQMLDMGFREELEAILAELPEGRRTHLVSATFSGEVLAVASRVQKAPLHLQGSPLGSANTDIEHIAHVVPDRHCYDALVNVLLQHQASEENPGRVLVFTRTRIDTAEVAERLNRDGFKAEPLSGDLAQASRTRTLEAFRRGRVGIIVATDVAARGLDVDGVSLVVHFDPPGDADAMTHRSGRTGRAGQKGKSVLLLVPQARRRIERMLAQARITPTWAPVPSPDKIRKLFTKLGRRKVFAELANDPDTEAIGYAQKLLAEHPAERVIAVLLSMTEAKLPAVPREIATVSFHESSRSPKAAGRENTRASGRDRPGFDRPSFDRPGFDRPVRDRPGPAREGAARGRETLYGQERVDRHARPGWPRGAARPKPGKPGLRGGAKPRKPGLS